MVFAANCDSNTVTVIRGDSRAATTVKVGYHPCAIAITPNGRMAFVVGVIPGTVTAIRTVTRTAAKPICDPD
jgi:YVTN family beta-propeller protein